MTAQRTTRLAALLGLLRLERNYSATAARRWRLANWVLGRDPHARKGRGGFAPEGIKICSAEQRRRTPPEFAAYLVRLARAVRR